MFRYLILLIICKCINCWSFGFYPNISGEDCGLQYIPRKVRITYPLKCFVNKPKNFSMDELLGQMHFSMFNPPKTTTRLYGAVSVEWGEAPWVVQIKYVKPHSRPRAPNINTLFPPDLEALRDPPLASYCTGVLLNKRWILTAASCNFNFTSNGDMYPLIRVFVGKTMMYEGGQSIMVNGWHVYRHPHYRVIKDPTNIYDIAVYRLSRDVDMKRLENVYQHRKLYMGNSICLPKAVSPGSTGGRFERYEAMAYGWGFELEAERTVSAGTQTWKPWNVQKGVVTIEPNNTICRDMICTDHRFHQISGANTRLCVGDFGGPLVLFNNQYQTRAAVKGIASGVDKLYCNWPVTKMYWSPVAVNVQWITAIINKYN